MLSLGWQQTKLAGNGAMRGLMEVEKGFEILVLGAYYKVFFYYQYHE